MRILTEKRRRKPIKEKALKMKQTKGKEEVFEEPGEMILLSSKRPTQREPQK